MEELIDENLTEGIFHNMQKLVEDTFHNLQKLFHYIIKTLLGHYKNTRKTSEGLE